MALHCPLHLCFGTVTFICVRLQILNMFQNVAHVSWWKNVTTTNFLGLNSKMYIEDMENKKKKKIQTAALKKETLFGNIMEENEKKKTLFSENSFIYYNTQRMLWEVGWFVHRRDWMKADFCRINDARTKKNKNKTIKVYSQQTSRQNSFIFPISEQLLHPPLHPDPTHPHPPIHTLQRGLQHPTSQDIKMDLWPGSILSSPPPPPPPH